jgi:hypothetical protein
MISWVLLISYKLITFLICFYALEIKTVSQPILARRYNIKYVPQGKLYH